MRSLSKTIYKNATTSYRAWQLPDVEDGDLVQDPLPPETENQDGANLLTAQQLEELQKQAYQEAFERGRKEGFEYGLREGREAGRNQIEQEKAQLRVKGARLETLLHALEHPFEELDEEVVTELVALTKALVKQLVRREIKTDPGQIVAVVRESLNALPVRSRNLQVHLHPEDAAVVRTAFTLNDAEPSWTIIEDPTIARGGCRVISESSRIDVTLESQLAALIASVFGGERQEDLSP